MTCDAFPLGYGSGKESNADDEFEVGSRLTVDWHVNLESLPISWET